MPGRNPLIIRADASVKMGTGHIMRCLALAQAWQDHGEPAVFLMASKAPAVEGRLLSEGMEVLQRAVLPGSVEDAKESVYWARKKGSSWIVVDGYHFGAEYQRVIKDAGFQLLLFDDFGHAGEYSADIVLNQNLHADERLYRKKEAYTQLLAGTTYVLLRREFAKWRDWRRNIPGRARRVLVTLGGGDYGNVTRMVIDALKMLKGADLEVVVIAGPENPHFDVLSAAVNKSSPWIRLERNIPNMPELMAWADLAISGGGGTCWELAFFGLPTCIVILAENQGPVAEELAKRGAALNLGRAEVLDRAEVATALEDLISDGEKRRDMSRTGRILVDGRGCDRVRRAMLSRQSVSLRKARESDCRMVWEWANDPVIRGASFQTGSIQWGRHREWFASKLRDPACLFLIGEDRAGKAIGQIRFDIEGNEARVSVSIGRGFRGLGLGEQLIREACKAVIGERGVVKIQALVKDSNVISLKTFERAGFESEGNTVHSGVNTTLMTFGNRD